MNRRDRIREKIYARVKVEDRGYKVNGEVSPCHIWQGRDSGNGRGGGYPRMEIDGGTVAVHIAIFVNENGIIPPKKQIDHLCRQRMCCNEDHLEMVTHKQNQKRKLKNVVEKLVPSVVQPEQST